MNQATTFERKADAKSGMPLGGIGSGGIEIGADGWFRNITINNNRTTQDRIPLAANAFLAAHIESEGRTYWRILQEEYEALPGVARGGPPRLRRGQIAARGLFPAMHFRLLDPDSPAEITWSCFSTLVPFDYDAAAMPVFFVSVGFTNPFEHPIFVSALFNWENICGHAGRETVPARERIVPAIIEDKPRYEIRFMQKEATAPGVVFHRNPEKARASSFEPPPPPPANAVLFGTAQQPATNAHGEYCLAVRHLGESTCAILPWDHLDPTQQEAFWRHFETTGLPGGISACGEPVSGAVGLRTQAAPGARQRIDFALTWNCPRFDSRGIDMGNAYSIKRKNAFEVSRHALEHVEYFYSASSELQKRFLKSSLPDWLITALVNSLHVFNTNTLYTRQGAFAMIESPDAPETARLDHRLYSSIGTILFFPRFEETELHLIANAEKPGTTGRLSRSLGTLSVNQPDLNTPASLYVELGAQLVLTACRNYIMTGKLVRFQDLLPVLKTVMTKIASRDHDADGMPDIVEPSITFDGVEGLGLSSYAAGLWLAALRVYSIMAERQGDRADAAKYGLLCKRAAESFERLYWDEAGGYYRLYPSGEKEPPGHTACHTAQLAGQWYADFLGAGSLHPDEHVGRALDTIVRLNAREDGYLSAVLPDGSPCPVRESGVACGTIAWPSFVRAHLHSLQLYRGGAGAAMDAIDRQYGPLLNQDRIFRQPLTWNLETGAAPPDTLDRHASTLSVWHVLYALQGLLLDVPGQRLRIQPNLPSDVTSISTPLVTPLCLGWLKYKIDYEKGYRQRIRISFDSPVRVRTVELRLPAEVSLGSVTCNMPDGPLRCVCTLAPERGVQRLLVEFENTISLHSGLTIQASEAAAESS